MRINANDVRINANFYVSVLVLSRCL